MNEDSNLINNKNDLEKILENLNTENDHCEEANLLS